MTNPSRPLVSVVVPTYGRNDRLVETVGSVVDQTYPNIELLVVDDASPTPIEGALDGLPLERLSAFRLIRHEENGGANAARNTGIEAATGEYIAFLDDDDRWVETKVERQVEVFERSGPAVGVVYVGKRTEAPHGTFDTILEWEGDVLEDLLLGRNFNQFSSIMVRASVVEAAGPTDERFPSWQDREWLFRLAQHCEFRAIPEPLTLRDTTHDDRIGRNFETTRDVTYPLLVGEYLPLAEAHGPYLAGAFLASLRVALGKQAVATGRYGEARKYLLLAVAANPLYRPAYPYLFASLGGRWTHVSARLVGRLTRRLREAVASPS